MFPLFLSLNVHFVTYVYILIYRHGYCEKCNFRLKLLNLKDQDFNDLREAFLQRAVMKSDIYINTTAGEFKKYMELIDTFKPFHVVLDGLNAAYSYQGFLSKKNLSMHVSYIFFKIQCMIFLGISFL